MSNQRAAASPARRPPGRAAALVALAAATVFLGTAQATGSAAVQSHDPSALVAGIAHDMASAIDPPASAGGGDAKARLARMARVTSEHADFDYMARLVLGDGWDQASAEQRRRFVAEFRTLLLLTFAEQVARHVGDEAQFAPARMNEARTIALVRAEVTPSTGPKMTVDYRLRAADGRWKLFDISVDGVSIVATFRGSFGNEVRKNGMDALIAQLVAQNRRLQGT